MKWRVAGFNIASGLAIAEMVDSSGPSRLGTMLRNAAASGGTGNLNY